MGEAEWIGELALAVCASAIEIARRHARTGARDI